MSDGALAASLRLLRERGLGQSLTQKRLSDALGISAALIASWEAGKVVPPPSRLEDYATFFATPRSLDSPTLLSPDGFTAEETSRRHELLHELIDGSEEKEAESPDFWKLPDDAPVRIVCGALVHPPDIADPTHRNYIRLAAFADLDSLVALYAHVWRWNPNSDVRFLQAAELVDDDLTSTHLVLLGNLGRIQTEISAWLPNLPVRQVVDDHVRNGEVFVVEDGRRFGPVPAAEGPGGAEFVEDVGFLARMPSPLDPNRTLTLCSGIFTHGVYGAVKSTTDQRIAAANTEFLRKRFDPARPSGVLMRVRVATNLRPTPRLDDDNVRLFEFP